MPRRRKEAHLIIRRREGRQPVYTIKRGTVEISTGCGLDDFEGAEKALAEYAASRFQPDTGQRDISKVWIAEVMTLFLQDLPANSPSAEQYAIRSDNLLSFWGEKSLADVKARTCNEYVQFRPVKAITARNELKTLQAAINHWHKDSPLAAVPSVTLPHAVQRRERVLTRKEAATMLWKCRTEQGNGRKHIHISRIIRLGLATGTRKGALCSLRWTASLSGGHVDLERGVMHRRGAAERETSKRRPPVALDIKTLSMLRRWAAIDDKAGVDHVINRDGGGVKDFGKAWAAIVADAGLGRDVIPHTLKHTCVTWRLWGRPAKAARPEVKPMPFWQISQIVGTSALELERTYAHYQQPEERRQRA